LEGVGDDEMTLSVEGRSGQLLKGGGWVLAFLRRRSEGRENVSLQGRG